MNVVLYVLHRCVAPFLAGMCMAATAVVEGLPAMLILLAAAAMFGFLSLPVGVRTVARLADEM